MTTIYAALLTMLLLVLSLRVISRRRALGVSVGDGGDRQLQRLIRVHANCTEYAPLGLILLLLAELQGAPALALHVLGHALAAGRLAHAIGMSGQKQRPLLRVTGMVLTFAMLGATSLGLLTHALV